MIHTEYMLKCDECLMIEAFTASDDAKTARQEGRRQGWKRVGRKDLCPECYEKLLASNPTEPPF